MASHHERPPPASCASPAEGSTEGQSQPRVASNEGWIAYMRNATRSLSPAPDRPSSQVVCRECGRQFTCLSDSGMRIRSPSPDSDLESPPSPPLCSPPAPDRSSSRGASQTHIRSRSRIPDSDLDRGKTTPSRAPYDPQHSAFPKTSQNKQLQQQQHRKQAPTPALLKAPPESDMQELETDPGRPHTSIQPQPKTNPIPPEQLVAEVKGIYTGLVMIEGKCIEVDNAQSRQKHNDLNSEQWTALVTLHRTLLHEHHDFFLASQQRSANITSPQLPSKDGIPAIIWRHGIYGSPEAQVPSRYATLPRMWPNGIHRFPEALRPNLPHNYDHMLSFVHTAYDLMAAWLETVPAFDINLAPDKEPCTARLHHHPAAIPRLRAFRGASERGNLAQRPPNSPDSPESSHRLAGDFSRSTNHPSAEMIHTDHWCPDDYVEEDEKQFEFLSMQDRREERELWRRPMLAASGSWWRWKWKLKHRHLTKLCHAAAGVFVTLPTVAAQPVEREKPNVGDLPDNPAHRHAQLLNWALPPTFLLMLAYVELAGRYYQQRRKWYIIAMVLSNLSFPWLVEHDGISPMFTVCVFAFALRPAWAYAMMDYDELRPSPAFYTIMAIGGFGIAAMITALSQNGSIPGVNSSSGGNPFSAYLLFGMTASMILCGRGLAACREWINTHALPR